MPIVDWIEENAMHESETTFSPVSNNLDSFHLHYKQLERISQERSARIKCMREILRRLTSIHNTISLVNNFFCRNVLFYFFRFVSFRFWVISFRFVSVSEEYRFVS
jgi:hypothetical protein